MKFLRLKKYMKILLIFTIITIGILYMFGQTEVQTNTQYIILKKIKNIEIRDYKESVNASYYSNTEQEQNNYFRNLAAYIFGDNSENKSISMTSPVTMRLHGNKEMIFRMPEEYTLENLPKANNPKINFVVIPPCKKAAIRYGGYSNDRIEKKKILELKKTLQENNINHDEKFEVLVYNSPYKILNRRNEITVNITYP
ncbi:MAG: hypothetical protein CMD03_04655 [Flavobacteriales bacterium]|nr:hypothetical protein [Flavobacteriales bacterium]